MHLHMPLDKRTFEKSAGQWRLGVKAVTIYPSQAIYSCPGSQVPARAEWRYRYDASQSRDNGVSHHQHPVENYNKRRLILRYSDTYHSRWYPGIDTQMVNGKLFIKKDILNKLGTWLVEHALSIYGLQKVWPTINEYMSPDEDGFIKHRRPHGLELYDIKEKYVNENWNPDGTTPTSPTKCYPDIPNNEIRMSYDREPKYYNDTQQKSYGKQRVSSTQKYTRL
ncbi:hypothetical protein BKA56DRAFT_677025 [Ilyonectria sp. MPI-CAGE-AT-0026]|nr:hypothetical protein BKA56DRAFT_677025 [Ilyonectria sp. MPI-CAGE-AT-0026]